MTEAQATIEIPRTRDRIRRELNAADTHRAAIMKLVAECAAMDIRPLLWVQGEIIPARDLDIPQNIREAYAQAAHDVARLQNELARSYDR